MPYYHCLILINLVLGLILPIIIVSFLAITVVTTIIADIIIIVRVSILLHIHLIVLLFFIIRSTTHTQNWNHFDCFSNNKDYRPNSTIRPLNNIKV